MKASTKIKEAKSIEGNVSCSSVVEILKYYPQTDSYKVKFDVPDNNDSYINRFKANKLRTYKPLEHSKIELEFFKNHK
jgi:hypothetical protein